MKDEAYSVEGIFGMVPVFERVSPSKNNFLASNIHEPSKERYSGEDPLKAERGKNTPAPGREDFFFSHQKGPGLEQMRVAIFCSRCLNKKKE